MFTHISLALLLHLSLWVFSRRQNLTRLSFTICIVITDVNAMWLSCIAYHILDNKSIIPIPVHLSITTISTMQIP